MPLEVSCSCPLTRGSLVSPGVIHPEMLWWMSCPPGHCPTHTSFSWWHFVHQKVSMNLHLAGHVLCAWFYSLHRVVANRIDPQHLARAWSIVGLNKYWLNK